MIFLAILAGVLLCVAGGCWMYANSPNYPPEAKAGYTFAVYFVLLAATILVSGVNLVIAAKASSATAIGLMAVGLFSKRWAKRLHHARIGRLLTQTRDEPEAAADAYMAERGILVALQHLLDGEIRLVAVTLGLTSAVVWFVVWAVRLRR